VSQIVNMFEDISLGTEPQFQGEIQHLMTPAVPSFCATVCLKQCASNLLSEIQSKKNACVELRRIHHSGKYVWKESSFSSVGF